MRKYLLISLLCSPMILLAQVGIGTTDPQGALDVETSNNLGFILPRVTSVENVTNTSGASPVDGTMVFDTSLGMPCVFTNGKWACFGFDSSGNPTVVDGTPPPFDASAIYIKASNTQTQDNFGNSLALSADGNTLAVGAFREDSNATGIGGNDADNSLTDAGAVYIYTRSGGTWTFQAYIKASNTESSDNFGRYLSISGDGNVLAVGAALEDSNATGIGGNQASNSFNAAGAVYIFSRSGSTWTQDAYVKASNTGAGDQFGASVAVSDDGLTVAVAAPEEDSNATGVGGTQSDNSTLSAGAVYVFVNSGGTWSQQAYVKASNSSTADNFGVAVSLSQDGNTMVVGAHNEDSDSDTINSGEADDTAISAGAAFVFTRSGSTWSQQAYLKASNSDAGDFFGVKLDISGDGDTIAIGAYDEMSSATGVNGDATNNTISRSGAAYVFTRSGGVWSQDAYLKSSNNEADDRFGGSLAINFDGTILAVGAGLEDSNANGLNGDQTDNAASSAGAVYLFERGTNWFQSAYIKAADSGGGDVFGGSANVGYTLLGLSADGSVLAAAGYLEDGGDTGVGGDPTDNTAANSGAVYIYQD